MEDLLEKKRKRLEEIIEPAGRAAVAVSGGVDSTFLCRIAYETLGNDNFLAVFISSPLLTLDELVNIKAVADGIGCRLQIVEVNPLSWPEFTDNPPNRCYLCKKKIYSFIKKIIQEQNIATLMDGTNLDDLSDYRPGLQALKELGVKTPLVEADLNKAEIRQLSRQLELPNWNRPSASCLATRIPTGNSITKELLAQVAGCEKYLHNLGFLGCRVRIAGREAHIELAAGDIERFAGYSIRNSISIFFADFGIDKVLLNILERK